MKKRVRPPPKVKVNLGFTPKALLELEELSNKLNISRSDVVALAVFWFSKTEPKVRRKRKNGNNHAGV